MTGIVISLSYYKMGNKIVSLMERTAAADSHVTVGEKKLIDHVKENYTLS